jgi:hypothetical protein
MKIMIIFARVGRKVSRYNNGDRAWGYFVGKKE